MIGLEWGYNHTAARDIVSGSWGVDCKLPLALLLAGLENQAAQVAQATAIVGVITLNSK